MTIAVLLIACLVVPTVTARIITTSIGTIYGRVTLFQGHVLDEYLGVPYAEPPVGDLRFKKPVPKEPSMFPVLAVTMPPGCPQFSIAPVLHQSEDCLYLNIWVPNTPSRKKSVLYWIHGGGFAHGSINNPLYDGKALAVTGDVIVVTVGFRLNALGFLYSGTKDAPGNVGLYDVLLGLQWVNANIIAFGGDPGSITIMGESSGAITVGIFTVSPLARGLYKRAIMESATATNIDGSNKTQNAHFSQALAEAVDCADESNTIMKNPSGVVRCLRGVSSLTLAIETRKLKPNSLRVFQPQFGDDLVPRDTRQAVIAGDFHNSEILIGSNKDEGSITLVMSKPDVFGILGWNNALFDKSYGADILRDQLSVLGDPQPVIEHYLGRAADDDLVQIRNQTYFAIGDMKYVCPDLFYAESFAKKRNNVYFYYFMHRSSLSPWAHWMGVTHFSEIPFVFGLPTLVPLIYKQFERELSTYMMQKWTNFAKTGSPGDEWPEYTTDDRLVLLLGNSTANLYSTAPQLTDCNIFRKYFGF